MELSYALWRFFSAGAREDIERKRKIGGGGERCKAEENRNVDLGTQYCMPFSQHKFHRPLKNRSGDGHLGQNLMFALANNKVFC